MRTDSQIDTLMISGTEVLEWHHDGKEIFVKDREYTDIPVAGASPQGYYHQFSMKDITEAVSHAYALPTQTGDPLPYHWSDLRAHYSRLFADIIPYVQEIEPDFIASELNLNQSTGAFLYYRVRLYKESGSAQKLIKNVTQYRDSFGKDFHQIEFNNGYTVYTGEWMINGNSIRYEKLNPYITQYVDMTFNDNRNYSSVICLYSNFGKGFYNLRNAFYVYDDEEVKT